MTVTVNTKRAGVEISWDPSGGAVEPPVEEKPPGVPTHPIFLPPYVDNTLPGEQPHPDQGLPGEQPEIDNELPGPQPRPEHPIWLPPYIDNSLPGDQPVIDNSLPEIEEIGLSDEQIEKLKSFLEGNLPETGGPEYPSPVSVEASAVQVFGQGQDGDWSNTAVQPNDGLALLSYPKGFSGESYIEVRALDGTLVDSGTIQVEA